MPFVRLESKSGWSRLKDMDGEEHWLWSKDLSTAVSCIVVKSQVAALRVEAFRQFTTRGAAHFDRYTPLKKLDILGEWIKVEDENGRQS